MNWDAASAIGEIIGAVAVVVSLIYLAAQIRNQTIESRIAAIDALTQQWGELMRVLGTTPGTYEFLVEGQRDFDSLSDADRGRMSAVMFNFTQIAESLHYHYVSARLDEDIWAGFEVRISELLSMPGARSWWELRGHWHSKRFQTYVNELLSNAKDSEEWSKLLRSENTPNKAIETDA